MFKKNRKVSKDQIDQIPLIERVAMEASITDTRASRLDATQFAHLNFNRYKNSIDWRRFAFGYLGDVAGKTVLDIACGYSMTPVLFALAGAHVTAVDVAPLTLQKVQEVAELTGVDDRVSIHCGPAETLPFKDNAFDIIYGGAALHHLILEQAGPELSRLLKPGGRGAFQDPLGNNKLTEFIRDNLNYANKHQEKGIDKPLLSEDISLFGQFFKNYSWRGFGLTTSSIRVLKKLRVIRRPLEKIDFAMLNTIPGLQKYAQYSVICVSN